MAAKSVSYTPNFALIDLLLSSHHCWNSSSFSDSYHKDEDNLLSQSLATQDFYTAIVAIQNGAQFRKECFVGWTKDYTIKFIMDKVPDNLIGRITGCILNYFPEGSRFSYFAEVVMITATRPKAARFLLCRLAIHHYFGSQPCLKIYDVSFQGLKSLRREVSGLIIETQTMISYPLSQITRVINLEEAQLTDFKNQIATLELSHEPGFETTVKELNNLIKRSRNQKLQNHIVFQALSRLQACEDVLRGIDFQLTSAIKSPHSSQWCVVRDSLGNLQGIANYEHFSFYTNLNYLYSGHWNSKLPIHSQQPCYYGIGIALFEEVMARSFNRLGTVRIELTSTLNASSFYIKMGCSKEKGTLQSIFNHSEIYRFLAERAGGLAPSVTHKFTT